MFPVDFIELQIVAEFTGSDEKHLAKMYLGLQLVWVTTITNKCRNAVASNITLIEQLKCCLKAQEINGKNSQKEYASKESPF